MPATAIQLTNLTKRFGAAVALRDVNLRIEPGELFFLLGPSGCGKTTLLRIIAGLTDPDSGSILFNDQNVTHLKTNHREAVMCFQGYAIWPHMTVRQNVSFGLEVRKLPAAQLRQRVDDVLAKVQLLPLADRKPDTLSGGQQQRIALARALAVEPRCLLLDEPLSNLDAALRDEMRLEIRRICKSFGLTTVYVTHDQKEAMSIADRIAVMRDGQLAQVGTPHQLYDRPANSFVAQFMGRTNLIPGTILNRDAGTVRIQTTAAELLATDSSDRPVGSSVLLCIRPQNIRVLNNGPIATPSRANTNRLTGPSTQNTFLGDSSEHLLDINGQLLRVTSVPPLSAPPRQITVEFDATDVILLKD